MPELACPLCKSTRTTFFYEDDARAYYQCKFCELVFVPQTYHLSPDEERARYDLHENDPKDEGYRKFLGRFFQPVNKKLSPKSRGLDFGCGPGPTLHRMFEDAGHTMQTYDIFYDDTPSVFDQTYDFITATEVVEHLHDPLSELNRLWECLKAGGLLGIMTKLVRNKQAFKDWHYIRDETHVAFFSRTSFRWLAHHWSAQLEFVKDDVIIFTKGQ